MIICDDPTKCSTASNSSSTWICNSCLIGLVIGQNQKELEKEFENVFINTEWIDRWLVQNSDLMDLLAAQEYGEKKPVD